MAALQLHQLSCLLAVVAVALFFRCTTQQASTADSGGLPCSEAICGPRVSKCMLIKSCNCTISRDTIRNKNCSCCAECVKCLDSYYTDCCSCVGLCAPPSGISDRIGLKSYVDELGPDVDARHLFQLLVEQADLDARWSVHSFPALSEAAATGSGLAAASADMGSAWQDVNCTVAYINQCLSSDKCAKACESMGASSYRWFHSGCCECVGDTCINYGSRVPRCTECKDEIDDYDDLHGEL